MTTKHTPGPWQLINEGSSVATADKECKIVAVIFGDDKQCKLDDRLKSNALLIAAAPDLLESLQWAIGNPEDAAYWLTRARHAIAKATGEKI